MAKCDWHEEFADGIHKKLDRIDVRIDLIFEKLDAKEASWTDRILNWGGAVVCGMVGAAAVFLKMKE